MFMNLKFLKMKLKFLKMITIPKFICQVMQSLLFSKLISLEKLTVDPKKS